MELTLDILKRPVPRSPMKIASRPFCPPTTLKIRTSESTLLQSLGSPHPPAPNGVVGCNELVSEPRIFAHKKALRKLFGINTYVNTDSKQLEVLQNQRFQKTGGEGDVILNQRPSNPLVTHRARHPQHPAGPVLLCA